MELKSKTICNYFCIAIKLIVLIHTVAKQYLFLFAKIFEVLGVDFWENYQSQFILRIAQLRAVGEDLCQHYLVMEHVNHSKVWKHFSRNDGNESATCTHCSKTTSCKGSSFSGLFLILEKQAQI